VFQNCRPPPLAGAAYSSLLMVSWYLVVLGMQNVSVVMSGAVGSQPGAAQFAPGVKPGWCVSIAAKICGVNSRSEYSAAT